MNLIPAPRSVRTIEGPGVTIDGSTSINAADASLEPIAAWLREEISGLASIDLGVSDAATGGIVLELDPSLSVPLTTGGVSPTKEALDKERHTVVIDANGARVTGATPEGVFRGASTLLHLIAGNAADGRAVLESAEIVDAPRFAWRGLSFDVVRTFHPPETVRKVIDLLALYKMNVLHLHLTDSEGWRFEVPAHSELTAVAGATARNDRPGGFYSQEEYAAIVEYAAERFVTIVPEFDSPGHTASVLRAYPELATPEILATPDAMQYLHPDIPGVWDLVGAVYQEMARVHPGGWMHIGGDEAIAMDEETFGRYMGTAMNMARGTGKGIVAWQESARAGFSPGDLMQLWVPPHLVERIRAAVENPDRAGVDQSSPDLEVMKAFAELFLDAPEDLPKALEQGANVVISRADKLYLDTKYVEPSSDASQSPDHQRVGLRSEVYGNGTVQDSYEWDPASLQEDLPHDRIAGVEGAIWCETIENEHDLMFQLLPRLPGVAEKGWSDRRGWADYLPRLAAQRQLWDTMGLNYFVSSVVWPEG